MSRITPINAGSEARVKLLKIYEKFGNNTWTCADLKKNNIFEGERCGALVQWHQSKFIELENHKRRVYGNRLPSRWRLTTRSLKILERATRPPIRREFLCQSCKHQWISLQEGNTNRICPKCKSHHFVEHNLNPPQVVI